MFPTKILHLENFGIAYYTNLSLSCYVGTCMESGVLSSDYPCKKDAPEDKDPPEGKKLPNLSGPCLSKVIPSSS